MEDNEEVAHMNARLQTLVAAAESCDVEAMTDLALVYARGEELQRVDVPKAIGWYWRAAAGGSRRACG